ncbi:MAG: polysulfide reductase NrfD [Candidatus Rokubacteria bacterium]|nr:polysulfide reductase NrfD [Candidatus Rokubacteria bacterium]
MSDAARATERAANGQDTWGWKVAVYLFVSGMGAGAYATGAAAEWLDGAGAVTAIALALGPLLVGPAALFLIVDLGRPAGFLRAGRRPSTSWIARGVVILSAFLAASVLHAACALLDGPAAARLALAAIGGALAILTTIYTGLLLGAIRPIPFWTTPILPLLFAVSSLSTGIMAVDLVATLAPRTSPSTLSALRSADLVLLASEAVVVALYLALAHATVAARASTALVTRGALARRFWGGVVAAGLAVPFVVQLAEVSGALPAAAAWTALSSGAGLAGGFFLRQIVIAGGVKSPLNAAGMLFTLPGHPRAWQA